MFEFDYILIDSLTKKAEANKIRKYIHIFIPLIVSVEYFIKFFRTKNYVDLIIALGLTMLLYLIFFIFNKISDVLVKKINKKFMNQKVNIVFSDSNFHVKNKKDGSFESDKTYEWNMVYKFKQDKSYYCVYISRFESFIIPKGSCLSGNEQDFASFVERKIAENKGKENDA